MAKGKFTQLERNSGTTSGRRLADSDDDGEDVTGTK